MQNFTEKGVGGLGEEMGGLVDHTLNPRLCSLEYKRYVYLFNVWNRLPISTIDWKTLADSFFFSGIDSDRSRLVQPRVLMMAAQQVTSTV